MRVLMLDGDTNIALYTARCLAQAPEVRLSVLAETGWSPLRFSRHKASYLTAKGMATEDASDSERLAFVLSLIRDEQIDVVLPIEDEAVAFVSRCREALAEAAAVPPIPLPEMLKTATNKWRLAQFLAQHNIPSPTTILFTGNDQVKDEITWLPLPVLCKPAYGRSGNGIRFFDDPQACLNHLRQIEPAVDAPPFIIQSYVPGFDVDCSVLCRDGEIVAHTIQKGFIPRSSQFAPAAGIEFINDGEILNLVTRLMRMLGYSGVAHLDLRCDVQTGQVKLIEINTRFWGSLVGSLVVGVNFPYLACLAALNRPFEYPEYQLGRYVDFSAVIKQGIRRLVRKSNHNFGWEDTGLRYVLADPVAEMVRLVKQM